MLDWFRRIPTVRLLTKDHQELLRSAEVGCGIYVAVPHNLHELLYLDVLAAGKDLLAEKPFGIDLTAARSIARGSEGERAIRAAVQAGVSIFTRGAAGVAGGAVREAGAVFGGAGGVLALEPTWTRTSR